MDSSAPAPKRPTQPFGLVVKDTMQLMKQAQLLLVASSLAYTTILSFIPLLAVSFAIFQAYGGLESLNDTIEPFIINNLAEGVSDDVAAKIQTFISNAHAGAVGIGGLVGLIFTSMSMIFNVDKAVNRVWRTQVERTLLQRFSAYWIFVGVVPLGIAIFVAVSTSAHLPLTSLFPNGTGAFVLTAIAFTAFYKWVPHVPVNIRCAAIGGLAIAIVFHLTQSIFRFYTSHVLTYSRIYGSLGAVPILLLWIYVMWVVVLSGAAFTAALQKRWEGKSGEPLEPLPSERPIVGAPASK